MRSNCLFWLIPVYRRAIARWVRAGLPPGQEPYIVIRPSRKAPRWIPHFLLGYYSQSTGIMRMTSFKPIDPSDVPWWKFFLHLWFKGREVEGDFADTVAIHQRDQT